MKRQRIRQARILEGAVAAPPSGLPRFAAPALVAFALLVALAAGLGDSVTFDEGVHIASGLAALRTGDFRLNPEHPPLAKLWSALPLAVVGTPGPAPGTPGWSDGNTYELARRWLEDQVDGERVVRTARLPMLAVLGAFLCVVFASARAVFGRRAAVLALLVASLDPLVLAHGRLVTTDVAAALAVQAVLLAFARYLARPRLASGALVALALGVASVTKYSWIAVLPALAGMSLWGTFRRGTSAEPERSRTEGAGEAVRTRRLVPLLLVSVGAAGAVVLAIWAAYGFRYEPYGGDDARTAVLRRDSNAGDAWVKTREEGWEVVREDWQTGVRRDGALPRVVELARSAHALPEPYLFGLSYVDKWSRHRIAYLRGRLSTEGWASYFPVAFLVKTPVASLLLLGLACWSLIRRRVAVDPAGRCLLVGMAVFSATWLALSATGGLDIGLRHLLPVYPLLFAISGSAVAVAVTRRGRLLVGALAALLAVESLASFPHHLGFFNRLAGGPAAGREWLADSNLDWGQDLLRLRAWCRDRGVDQVHLAVHPTTPLPKGLRAARVLSAPPGEGLSPLTPGTYVFSVNTLVGLWDPMVRDETWRDPRFLENARRAAAWAGASEAEAPPEVVRRARRDAEVLHHARLVNRLRTRREDGRIGTSLLVFELTADDLRALSAF